MTTWGLIGSGTIGTGDDRDAKEVVRELLDQTGYDTVDLGPLSQGWRTQPGTAAYGLMYAVNPRAWDQGARPAPAVEVAERAAASRRRHDPTASATQPIRATATTGSQRR